MTNRFDGASNELKNLAKDIIAMEQDKIHLSHPKNMVKDIEKKIKNYCENKISQKENDENN